MQWRQYVKLMRERRRDRPVGKKKDAFRPSDSRRKRSKRAVESREWVVLEFDNTTNVSSDNGSLSLELIKWLAKWEVRVSILCKEMRVWLTRDSELLRRYQLRCDGARHTLKQEPNLITNSAILVAHSGKSDVSKNSVPCSFEQSQSSVAAAAEHLVSSPRIAWLGDGHSNFIAAINNVGGEIVNARECSDKVPESAIKEHAKLAVIDLRGEFYNFDRDSLEVGVLKRHKARRQCARDIEAHCCTCAGVHVEDCRHMIAHDSGCTWLRNKSRVLRYHDDYLKKANHLVRRQQELLIASRAKEDHLKYQLHLCCRPLEHSLERELLPTKQKLSKN